MQMVAKFQGLLQRLEFRLGLSLGLGCIGSQREARWLRTL